MKTKKLFLIAAVFLFLSVFFVGVEKTKAMDCYDLCGNEGDAMQACFNQCEASNSGGSWSDWTYDSAAPGTSASCSSAFPGSIDTGNNGDCVCPGGYDWNSTGTACEAVSFDIDNSDTWNMDNFETQNPVDSGGNSSNCDPDPSCWWYNCCSSQDSTYVDTSAQDAAAAAQSAAQTAADKAAANAAQTKALAATSVQNAATKIVNDKTVVMQQACSSGATQSAECIAAQKALDDAKTAYEKATEDAQTAIAEMDALSGTNYGSQGYASTGNSIGGVSYGVNVGFGNVPGVSAGSAASCGAGFEKMGGVCFPTTTGLSSAPISTILSNLFLWLMGLFVTFAVVAFVVSGIQYLLAAGDEGMAETAKKNATNAIIGIIVGLSGFIIFKAIAAALSGQSYLF